MTQKQEGKELKIVLGNAVSFSKPGIHEILKKKEGEAKGRGEGRGEVRGREDMGREGKWCGGEDRKNGSACPRTTAVTSSADSRLLRPCYLGTEYHVLQAKPFSITGTHVSCPFAFPIRKRTPLIPSFPPERGGALYSSMT